MRATAKLLLLCAFLSTGAACVPGGGKGDTHFDLIYDPCAPIVLEPTADATAEEREAVALGAEMWNEMAMTQLTLEPVEGAPVIPVEFDAAGLGIYGLYDDENGVVYINRKLDDQDTWSIVVAHEIGHAFGLMHVPKDERVSVMNVPNLDVMPNDGDMQAAMDMWPSCADPT